eukprot:gene1062-2080_t
MAHPTYRLQTQLSDNVAFCIAEIPMKSDEDRNFFSLSKLNSGLSSFGIFDGHGGNYASTTCARDLHNMISSRYHQAIDESNNYSHDEFVSQHMDHIFCESARKATVEIDRIIRQASTAGTTAVSLFLFPCPDGSTRVYCPWVGDSRCCMFKTEDGQGITVAMSVDHKPSLERESVRIKSRHDLLWTGLPVEIEKISNDMPIKSTHSVTPTLNDLSNRSITSSSSLRYREEYSSDKITSKSIIRTSYIGIDSLYGNDVEVYNNDDSENQDNEIQEKICCESFIARRSHTGQTVKTGPIAVFGRYGISLTMTRSIGDRYGPRSCFPVPDISATTIPANQFARFVLASDGFWDVFTNDDTERIALSKRNPQKAALKLAQMAFHRRMNHGMRFDDITVMVVDVNPKSFTPVTGTGCQCTMS